MNSHTFDRHHPSCPICHRVPGNRYSHKRGDVVRPLGIKRSGLDSGLYICCYCQERLVVSQNGHYVRDPFALVGVKSGRLLRRQSRPSRRMMRDLAVCPTFYVVASVVLLSFALAATSRVPSNGVSRLLWEVRKTLSSIKE